MTKIEFLDQLEKRLHILNQKERNDILSEYAQHIELKIGSGLSETAAISDFVDLDELVAEILDAYNVNPDYLKKGLSIDGRKLGREVADCATRAGHGIGRLFHCCTGVFGRWLDKLPKVTSSSNYFFWISLFVLMIIYVPFTVIAFFISDGLYSVLNSPFDSIAAYGNLMIYHVIYIFISAALLYAAIRKRGTKEKSGNVQVHASKWLKNLFILPGFPEKKEKVRQEKIHGSFLNSMWTVLKVCVIFIWRCIVIGFLAPTYLFLFFMVIAFGSLIVFLFMGYPVWGITLLILGMLMSGFAVAGVIWTSVFSKKRGMKE